MEQLNKYRDAMVVNKNLVYGVIYLNFQQNNMKIVLDSKNQIYLPTFKLTNKYIWHF